MKRTTRRRGLMAIAALLAVLFVARAGVWISAGCPTSFVLTSGAFGNLNGRQVTASSDHLFDEMYLVGDPQSAVIFLGPRRVLFAGDRATIDGTTRVDLPAACKAVEFVVRGDSFRVLADGKPLPQVAPAPAP